MLPKQKYFLPQYTFGQAVYLDYYFFISLPGKPLFTQGPAKKVLSHEAFSDSLTVFHVSLCTLSTEENAQCESCKLSFILGKMRTIGLGDTISDK